MERTADQSRLPPVLVGAILAAIVLAAASPLLAVPMAPALIVAGAVALRRASDPLARGLAWAALLTGAVLLALIIVFALGALATTTGSAVTEGGVEVMESPWPTRSSGP